MECKVKDGGVVPGTAQANGRQAASYSSSVATEWTGKEREAA